MSKHTDTGYRYLPVHRNATTLASDPPPATTRKASLGLQTRSVKMGARRRPRPSRLLLLAALVLALTLALHAVSLASAAATATDMEQCAESDHPGDEDTVCLAPLDGEVDDENAMCDAPAAAEQQEIDTAARLGDYDAEDVKRRHVVFVSIAIKGHALPLLRVASEMRARGYRVSFATHGSGKEWAHSYGVPFVSAGTFPVSADDLRAALKTMTRDASNFRGILTMFNDIYVAAARPMFEALLPHFTRNKPDLIIMDVATVGAQLLAHKLKLPVIVNSPSIMFDLGGAPSYVPAWGTGFSIHMSLWNRCMNILFPRLLSVALTPPFMEINKMRWELELTPFRSQHDLFKGARVILNTAFGLEHPQPLSPMIEPVGPIMPLRDGLSNASRPDRHPLPPSLDKWLSSAYSSNIRRFGGASKTDQSSTRGMVVYLNLGTMAYIDVWQAQALVEGLIAAHASDPRLKVLWVLPTDQRNIMPVNLPPAVLVKPPGAIADLDVLAHDGIRLVISHCGMVSAQEALVFGKPLLCIPFLVDQPDVAARVVDAGAGLAIDKNRLTAEEVHDAVVRLLTNGSYAAAANRVGRLIERAGGINRAIEIIDTTLRVGFDHLETVDLALPWHKTAMLDVWAVYAAIFCLVAVVIRVQWLLVHFLVSETFGLLSSILFGSDTGLFDDDDGASAVTGDEQLSTSTSPSNGNTSGSSDSGGRQD